jgi:hypothetical protein
MTMQNLAGVCKSWNKLSNSVARLIRGSFRDLRRLDDFDFSFSPVIKKDRIFELVTCAAWSPPWPCWRAWATVAAIRDWCSQSAPTSGANVIALVEFGTHEQKQRLSAVTGQRHLRRFQRHQRSRGRFRFVQHADHLCPGRKRLLAQWQQDILQLWTVADLLVAFATLNPELGPMGISSFLVEGSAPGVVRGQEPDKFGMRTSPMCDMSFVDCRVGPDALLGREGRGADVFRAAIQWERACIQAGALGAMRRQLEECVAHAKRRRQFGKPIGKFQSVANRLVDMKLRLETARLLIYKAAWLKDQGRDIELEAAMCKLHVGEAAVQSSLDAIQIHGARGYMRDLPFERQLRDAVGGTIYGGTSEIQRVTIARALGL